MKRYLKYSLAVSAVWLSLACTDRNQQKQHGATAPISIATDTLAYRLEFYKETSPYLAGETGEDTTFYAVRYPVFSSETDSLVRDAIFLEGEQEARHAAESFLSEYNSYAENERTRSSSALHSWFRRVDCAVALNIPGFLTLKNTVSEYTGGAHGIQIEVWSNYALQDSRLLSLSDLFQDTVVLQQIAEGYFRKQENLSDTSSYEDGYFFEDGVFALAANFGLVREGLLFHYNPYEIKAYAAGPTDLLVPYTALEAILTPMGKDLRSALQTSHKEADQSVKNHIEHL